MTKSWLDEYLESMYATLHEMKFVTLQPFSHLEFHPLYAAAWTDRLLELRASLENAGDSILKQSGPGATEYRVQLLYALLDSKTSRLERASRMELAGFFNRGILASSAADPYGFSSNLPFSRDEAEGLLKSLAWRSGSPENSRRIGKLYTAALHLTHGLYSDLYTDYSAENYGPYDVSHKYGAGHILVMRHFRDLRPDLLWKSRDSRICRALDIYTVYRGVKFKCAAVSSHSIYRGNLIENLVDFSVKADGKRLESDDEVDALTETLMNGSIGQWQAYTSLEFEEAKLKWLQQRAYTLKGLFDEAKMGWKPTPEMVDAVAGKRLVREEFWGHPEMDAKGYWMKILDPRVDFYPPGFIGP